MSIDELTLGSESAWASEEPRAGSKRCPRCGELLFEDMDVCYGCLYDFSREPYRLPEGMIGPTFEPELDEADMEPVATEKDAQTKPDVPDGMCGTRRADVAPSACMPLQKSRPHGRKLLLRTSEVGLGLPIPSRGLTLGRASDNDIVLQTDRTAEYHLVLVPRTDDVVAVGLVDGAFEGSSKALTEGCAFLREGDFISVGGLSIEVGCALVEAY